MMTRTQALDLLNKHVSSPQMIKHSLASEAVMRALALHFGADEEWWGLSGLLHDLDVEITHADPKTHGTLTPALLEPYSVPQEIVDAIVMHNEDAAPRQRQSQLEHALAAGETITGLITATTLVYPDKRLASVKPKSVVKRMKEKNFAATVKRENILECEKIGLPMDQFAEMAINAMRNVAEEIGL